MQTSFPDGTMEIFRQALEALNNAGVEYVVGGAFAVHHYTGVWRNTHDIDVYIERNNLPAAQEALAGAGFRDMGEMAAGDREWILHAQKNDALIDVIWQPPNRLSAVDASLYARASEGIFADVPVRFMPPDEVIKSKIFTINHQRSDWPDVFNVIRACPERLDWQRLLDRMGEHWPVLLSLIVLYDWTYPGETQCVPQEIREDLLRQKLKSPSASEESTREALLDPWIYSRPVSP